MSNHLAVATVSATLRHMLLGPVKAGVDNSDVVTDRPPDADSSPVGPEVRIFLHGVQPNAAWRNDDLPTRRSSGDLAQRPQAALDLIYLLSFYGDERALEPQRLLGIVVRELHVRPMLGREQIRKAIQESADSGILASDLADQPETVRFSPISLDLDEMSKLWSVFFQAPYRLSIAYQASVVLISPDETPRPALPVEERRIHVVTIRRPMIERIEPVSGPREPVTVGTNVKIMGSQLKGEITTVWFGTESVNLPSGAAGDHEVRVAVPASVRAGLTGVRIEHRLLMGEPPSERAAGSSNVAPLLIVPRIRKVGGAYQINATFDPGGGDARPGTITLTVDPAVGRRQRVSVFLQQTDVAAGEASASYSFADETRDVDGEADETNELAIRFRDVRSGTYLVQVQIDGAESLLDRDTDSDSTTFGMYVGPRVDMS